MLRYIPFVVFSMVGNSLLAQDKAFEYEASYVTELQFNLTDKHERQPKLLNLISIDTRLSTDQFWSNGAFQASFWSVTKLFSNSVVDDHLAFSNIDAGNHPLICSALGYEHTIKKVKIAAGIRNVNVDYFDSPCALFFTNSSAGICPTISLNYDAAIYPLAAFALHAEYEMDKLTFKNSFYNNLKGIDERIIFKFQFNPAKYGYLNFSQVEYAYKRTLYSVGCVFDKTPLTPLRYSLYASGEGDITQFNRNKLSFLTQLGLAPKHRNYCYSYLGTGLILSNIFSQKDKDSIGLMASHANMQDDTEWSLDLTYQGEINSFIKLQPSVHFIQNNRVTALAGLLRVIFSINN